MKQALSMLFVFLLLMPGVAAQTSAGILPGSVLWKLDLFLERANIIMTWDATGKYQLHQLHAEERLAEAQVDTEHAALALNEREQELAAATSLNIEALPPVPETPVVAAVVANIPESAPVLQQDIPETPPAGTPESTPDAIITITIEDADLSRVHIIMNGIEKTFSLATGHPPAIYKEISKRTFLTVDQINKTAVIIGP